MILGIACAHCDKFHLCTRAISDAESFKEVASLWRQCLQLTISSLLLRCWKIMLCIYNHSLVIPFAVSNWQNQNDLFIKNQMNLVMIELCNWGPTLFFKYATFKASFMTGNHQIKLEQKALVMHTKAKSNNCQTYSTTLAYTLESVISQTP